MAAEKITCITTNARSMGKTFRQELIMGVQITLENLWIPVKNNLPKQLHHGNYSTWSDYVLGLLENGNVIQTYYWEDKVTGRTGWLSVYNTRVTHWMPIPKKPK